MFQSSKRGVCVSKVQKGCVFKKMGVCPRVQKGSGVVFKSLKGECFKIQWGGGGRGCFEVQKVGGGRGVSKFKRSGGGGGRALFETLRSRFVI